MGALTLLILAIGSLIIFQSHRQQKKIKWFTEKVDLTGKIAVVTGGSSGLGLSSAIQEWFFNRRNISINYIRVYFCCRIPCKVGKTKL